MAPHFGIHSRYDSISTAEDVLLMAVIWGFVGTPRCCSFLPKEKKVPMETDEPVPEISMYGI